MNTLHLKISIFIALFLTFLCSLSAQEDVDYGARFYEIKYTNDTIRNCPDVDSVEVLNIYGKVFYRGIPDNIRLEDDNKKLKVKKGNAWIAYEIHGNHVDDGYSIIYSKDSLFKGLADAQGKIVIPIEYEDIEERFDFISSHRGTSSNFLNFVFKKNGKYGLLNHSNQVFLPFEYDGIDVLENDFGERMLALSKNKKVCFANVETAKPYTGFVFSDFWWDIEFGGLYNWRLIPVKKTNSDLWGFMDYNGEIIAPCKYKDFDEWSNIISCWEGYLFSAKKENNLWDVLDVNGKVILADCQEVYNGMDSVHNMILVKKNGKWFCLNSQTGETKYLVDNLSVDFLYGEGNYAVVKQNGHVGVMDILSGQIIIPCKYDFINLNRDNEYKIRYAACMNYENNTILDYIRLKDGTITQSYGNYKGKSRSMVIDARKGISYSWDTDIDYSGVNGYVSKSGYECIVSYNGQLILDESHKILPGKVRVSENFIITDKGVFDTNGKLIYGDDYELKCHCFNTYLILYNKTTKKREYFVNDNGEYHKVDSYDGIYRYYYTQCQEKFRKQPSDVDKNIPETPKTNNKTYAFIIANEDYPSIPVPYGLNDGRSFKTYCEKTLGIPTNHITMFENATTGQFIACVEQMKRAANANNGDIDIIFYYAGHAFPDGESKTYLLPIDGDATIPATGFGLDRLYEELGQMNVNSVICFMDACFSGVTRDDNMLLAGRGVIIKPKESKPRGNMVVFTAANSTETAHQYQAKKHGMFTYYLLKKLKESKGAVTLGELDDYLNSNVKKMSFEVNNKLQTPKVLVSPAMELKWRTLKLND